MENGVSAMPTATEILFYTLTCSLVALAVLLLKSLFRHRLGARVHLLLWGLLFLRLVVPVLPSSPFSVFNLAAPVQSSIQGIADDILSKPVVVLAAIPPTRTPPSSTQAAATSPTSSVVPGGVGSTDPNGSGSSSYTPTGMTLDALLLWIWAAGVLAVLLWFIFVYVRLRSQLRHATGLADDRLAALLEEATGLVGIRRRRIRIVELASARTPCISGVLRPVLVLPAGASRLPEEILRQVLVHELVHLKRGDIWSGWLTLAFSAVHWFNPFLWYVFRAVRQDLEIACDERVLALLGEERRIEYGLTLLAFAAPRAGWIPGSTAMASGSGDLSRRIRFLAFFRKPTRLLVVVAAVLVLAVGVLFLTDALPKGVDTAKAKLSKQDVVSLLEKGGVALDVLVPPTGASTIEIGGLVGDFFTVRGLEQSTVHLFVCESPAQRDQVAQAWNDFATLADFVYRMEVFKGKNILVIFGTNDDSKPWYELVAKALATAGISSPNYPAMTDPTLTRFTAWDVESLFSQGPMPISALPESTSGAQSFAGVQGRLFGFKDHPDALVQVFVGDSPVQRDAVVQAWQDFEPIGSYIVPRVAFEGKNVFLVISDLSADPESSTWFGTLDAVLSPAGIVRIIPLLTQEDIEVTFRDIGETLGPLALPTPPVNGGVAASTYSIQGSPDSYVELYVCDSAEQRVEVREDFFTAPSDFILSSAYQEVYEGDNVLVVLRLQDATSSLYPKAAVALKTIGIARIYPKS